MAVVAMATTDDAEKLKRRPKTRKKVADEQMEDEPSSYPKPDDGPDALPRAAAEPNSDGL